MNPTARVVLAAGVNLAAWDYLGRCAGLPHWAGLSVAGVAMALRTARVPLPPLADSAVSLVNAPGALLVRALDSVPELQEPTA